MLARTKLEPPRSKGSCGTYSASLRKCEIFVPTAGTLNFASGHHNIAWQIRNNSRYRIDAGGVDELIAELKSSEATTAVISSEDFEYLSQYPGELKTFDGCLEAAGFATKYLVYFRNEDAYARSLFCELRSVGPFANYDAFRKSLQDQGYILVNGDWYYEFRYETFIERWESILSDQRFTDIASTTPSRGSDCCRPSL